MTHHCSAQTYPENQFVASGGKGRVIGAIFDDESRAKLATFVYK